MASNQLSSTKLTGHCTLLSVPTEILQDISDLVAVERGHAACAVHLASRDILAFRLVCRKFSVIESKSLLAKVPRLYLQRSVRSMQIFNDLCSHPEFGNAVQEVAVLANNIAEKWTHHDTIIRPTRQFRPRSS